MARGGIYAWKTDEQGNEVMPELQAEFLAWLLSDVRVPSTQEAWAREHDLNEKTPSRWKRDPRFIREWEKAANEKNISVERVQAVLDTVYKAAAQGDLKAAELYLKHVDRISPPKRVEREDDLEALSDEELFELAAGLVSAETPEQEPVAAAVVGPPKLTSLSESELVSMLGGVDA